MQNLGPAQTKALQKNTGNGNSLHNRALALGQHWFPQQRLRAKNSSASGPLGCQANSIQPSTSISVQLDAEIPKATPFPSSCTFERLFRSVKSLIGSELDSVGGGRGGTQPSWCLRVCFRLQSSVVFKVASQHPNVPFSAKHWQVENHLWTAIFGNSTEKSSPWESMPM